MVECGTITWGEPSLRVSADCDVENTEVSVDEEVTVTAGIGNSGDSDFAGPVVFSVNGTEIATRDIGPLSRGETENVEVSFVPADIGLSTGTFDVNMDTSGISRVQSQAMSQGHGSENDYDGGAETNSYERGREGGGGAGAQSGFRS